MFTGIIEETGVVKGIKPTPKAIQLSVQTKICGRGLKVGDSVAVNGCCLTATQIKAAPGGKIVRFDLLQETWNRTNLQFAKVGSLVNLERSLRADSRLGGHFVTGHVDRLGKIVRWEKSGADWILEIEAPKEVMRYVVFKGSIAVDGISLTVAAVMKKAFRIWIIPHTYNATALKQRRVGEFVNLEADMLGKYVEKFTSSAVVA